MSSDESGDSSASEGTVDYPDTPDSSGSSIESYAQLTRHLFPFDDDVSPAASTQTVATARRRIGAPQERAPVTCECCCREDCLPAWVPGTQQLGRLSQLNDDSLLGLEEWALGDLGEGGADRLGDRVAVLGECGVHAVCVGCIRRAASGTRPPRCLAMGAACAAEYGAGVRWCFDPDEYAQRVQLPPRVVRCGCGAMVTRCTHMTENTLRGANVAVCSCGQPVCFDCGLSADTELLPDGRRQGFCPECRDDQAPPLRVACCFPPLRNADVTDAQVAGRAVQILSERGLSVSCDHCGVPVERADGCKYVTHCGTEMCSECNVRGCPSSGSVVGRCCPGSSELEAKARPWGRMALSLQVLFLSAQPQARAAALTSMGSMLRGRLQT
jgi:hypothetical protein